MPNLRLQRLAAPLACSADQLPAHCGRFHERQRSDESTNETRQSRSPQGDVISRRAPKTTSAVKTLRSPTGLLPSLGGPTLRRYGHRIQHARQASGWLDHGQSRLVLELCDGSRRSAAADRFVEALRRAGISGCSVSNGIAVPLPEVTATSDGALDFSIPRAARPRSVMRSANAPWSSSRRQTGNVPPAATSSTKPSFRSLVTALLATARFGFPVSSMAPFSRCAAADSSTSWLSVSFFGDMIGISVRLTTASRAVTTEAPHWRSSRRGRIPGGSLALRHAATVTLCWRRKASHFWRMLLLVSRTAEHGMISAIGCATRRLQLMGENVSGNDCRLPGAICARLQTSKELANLILRCRGSNPAASATQSGLPGPCLGCAIMRNSGHTCPRM
jgi:hypothetical protein